MGRNTTPAMRRVPIARRINRCCGVLIREQPLMVRRSQAKPRTLTSVIRTIRLGGLVQSSDQDLKYGALTLGPAGGKELGVEHVEQFVPLPAPPGTKCQAIDPITRT